VRRRDLTTLEFPRVLDAIARHARSGAGRLAVLALEPSADADEVDRRLQTLSEVIALVGEAGPPPTADLPAVGAALGYTDDQSLRALNALDQRKLLILLVEGNARLLGAGRRLAQELEISKPGR